MSWVGQKVRCLSSIDIGSVSLESGEIYTVTEEYESDSGQEMVRIAEALNKGFYVSRFELVYDEEPEPTSKLTEEQEESQLRARFTAPRSGNCGCNIPKEQCDYHREHIKPVIDWTANVIF